LATVGIAGTGRMGAAAARRLVEVGVPVLLANRTRTRAASLAAELGCEYAESFQELAGRVDVVLVLVSGDEGVRDAILGQEGILAAGDRRASTLVIMSTVRPELVTELNGIAVVDAPLIGRPAEFASGGVTILAGGTPSDVKKLEHLLSSLGQLVHVGPLGAGATMKLAMNLVIFGVLAAVSECMTLATAAGIAPAVVYDVLTGSALNSRFLELRRPYFVGDGERPVQFTMESARETLELVEDAASAVGVSLPMTRANIETLNAAVSSGFGDLDITSLPLALTSRAGR
jgi:3-hydroxyisobutyrate dehydrogenase-like beta-hydroxyacid dehydrogenase